MRISYVGMDGRLRVAEASRIKYLPDGFQKTDTRNEYTEEYSGPLLVVHIARNKGGKRLVLSVPEGADFGTTPGVGAAIAQALKEGWADFSQYETKSEVAY